MHNRIATMAVLCVVGLVMASVAACDEPAPKPLFEEVDMNSAKLSPKQDAVLERIRNARATVDVKLIKFQPVSLDGAPAPLSLPLQPGKKFELSDYRLTKGKFSQELTWDSKKTAQSATLTVVGDAVSGLIHANKCVYAIEPLGNSLHALVQVDQSTFVDEPAGEAP